MEKVYGSNALMVFFGVFDFRSFSHGAEDRSRIASGLNRKRKPETDQLLHVSYLPARSEGASTL